MATSDLDFPLDEAAVVVAVALAEDLGGADGVDVTTESTIDPAARATAQVVARAEGVIAGMPLVELVFGAVCDLLGDGRAHGDLPRDGRAHGERIAFALYLNGYESADPQASGRAELDRIVEILAGFTGKL